jgi:hypothetical protein
LQGGAQVVGRHGHAGPHVAGGLDDHEADDSAAALLVALDRGLDRLQVDGRIQRGGQPAAGQQPGDLGPQRRLVGERERGQQAEPDRL